MFYELFKKFCWDIWFQNNVVFHNYSLIFVHLLPFAIEFVCWYQIDIMEKNQYNEKRTNYNKDTI